MQKQREELRASFVINSDSGRERQAHIGEIVTANPLQTSYQF